MNSAKRETSSLGIYVASWDGYSDLWSGFFWLFFKFWRECPYPVYLGTNHLEPNIGGVRTLKACDSKQWSGRVKEHLAQIDHEYILIFLDDWYLNKEVNSKSVEDCISFMDRYNGEMLRLVPDPGPQYPLPGVNTIGMLRLGLLNRSNTHATIWRKTTLLNLLREDENLWQFEINASIRSNSYSGGFYCTWNRIISYDGAVDKGKWTRRVYSKYKNELGKVDFRHRRVKTVKETIIWKTTNGMASAVRMVTTHRIRQSLMNKIKMLRWR